MLHVIMKFNFNQFRAKSFVPLLVAISNRLTVIDDGLNDTDSINVTLVNVTLHKI